MDAEQLAPRPQPQEGGGHSGGTPMGQLSCAQCRSRKLKCDRKRPICDRCVEKNEVCIYPGPRQRGLGRRKTVRDLEERIEELEGLLRAANLKTAAHEAEQDQDPSLLGIDPPPPASHQLEDIDPPFAGPPQMDPGATANQLIDLGLFEQLPSFGLIDELTALFFQNIHAGAPMLHQASYTAALRLPAHMRPPMCLQYIVMASAAATSPTYRHLSEPFYQRARVYAEADELKGQGEVFTTVAHVQSWCLISAYECHVYAVFTRASTSLCRGVRIAQMLGLHQLDDRQEADLYSGLPPPGSCIEAEERRRTWWVVFLADRYLTSTTGWPSLIDERHIRTNLPSTEEAFATGTEDAQQTPLSAGLHRLEQGRGNQLSPLAIRILAANELLHALDHSAHRHDQDDLHNPDSRYWHRRREIDTNLTTLTLLLPSHLQLSHTPHGPHNLNTILVHICTNMAVLHLHRHAPPLSQDPPPNYRLLSAASAILSVLRAAATANSLPTAIRNPLLPFAAYMAASVFLTDCTQPCPADPQSEEHLACLADILVLFATSSPLVRANAFQLAVDMQRVGRGGMMERVIMVGGGEGEMGAEILAGGGKGKGAMVFCPALSSVAGGGSDEGVGGGVEGSGSGEGFVGYYDPSVLLGPSTAGPSVLQAASPGGLFSQVTLTHTGGAIP